MVEAPAQSAVQARLIELGLQLPELPAAAGAYLPAVATGQLVFTSGQLPTTGGSLPETGKVGGSVSPSDAKTYARICVLNGLAAAASAIGSLDRITRVVRIAGFVASDPTFTGQPGVIDGASELLIEIFGEAGKHSRSAVGVASLPLNSPVEVELVLEFI